MDTYLQCHRRRIPLDKDGYLKNLDDWDAEVAEQLAESCQIHLRESHWEIIRLVRHFYTEHELSPPIRPLVKLVARELGADKGRSIYLMKLFGGSPARTVNRIAGLPRPTNCI
jgi:tRNA 2-thiouridine synthesizing protein E